MKKKKEKIEEEVEESTGKKSSKKKKVVIVICSIFFVIAITIVGILLLTNGNRDDSYKIAKKIANELKKEYDNITFVEDKEDTTYKYSFLSATSIYIDSIGNKGNGKYAVSVAKYDSNLEALRKKEFYDDYNKYLHERFDNTPIELTDDYDDLFIKNEIFIIGKYLFSINPKIKNIDELKKNIEIIVKDYDISDIGKVDENELNKYWDEILDNFKNECEQEYNRIIEKMKKIFGNEIDNVKNCSTITSCKELIESYQEFSKYEEFSEELSKLNEEYKNKLIIIADFSSMSKESADNWCKEKGLSCSIKEEYSDTISNGGFISQSKEVNTEALKGDSITITYSMGRKPTQSELNALSKAQSYSDRQYMSKKGLYQQLTSQYGEGFTAEEAQYAIEHVKADWKYNALQKAQSYSDRQYMSKKGLYQQLTSQYGEGFTAEEAQYAIDNVKADWKYNALQKGKSYYTRQNMSKSSVYQQLVSNYGEGFTAEEAQYAIDHLDD